MLWPWISREHHIAIVAAMNRTIALLEAQNAILAVRLEQPTPVTVKVEFPPAGHAPPRRRIPESADMTIPKGPVDWAAVDENNPLVMAKLAMEEFGGPVAPHILASWKDRVTRNIRDARNEKKRAGRREAVSSSTIPPNFLRPEAAPHVPQHILDTIEAAEKGV